MRYLFAARLKYYFVFFFYFVQYLIGGHWPNLKYSLISFFLFLWKALVIQVKYKVYLLHEFLEFILLNIFIVNIFYNYLIIQFLCVRRWSCAFIFNQKLIILLIFLIKWHNLLIKTLKWIWSFHEIMFFPLKYMMILGFQQFYLIIITIFLYLSPALLLMGFYIIFIVLKKRLAGLLSN